MIRDPWFIFIIIMMALAATATVMTITEAKGIKHYELFRADFAEGGGR